MLDAHTSTNPLQIGFVIQDPWFDFDGLDAASLLVQYTVNGLRAASHIVNVLVLRRGRQVMRSDRPGDTQTARVKWCNTPGFRIPESGIRRVQSTFRLPYLALFDSLRFADACIQELCQVDIIHERVTTVFSLGPTLASQYLGKPFILSIDADPLVEIDYLGIPFTGVQRRYLSWATGRTYQHADAIICISEQVKQHLVRNRNVPETKVYVIPNKVDTVVFSPSVNGSELICQQFGIGDVPVVMFVGSFWPWHGLDLLVKSFLQVLERVPRAKLVLVGDGVTKPAIMQQVAEYHLEGSIIITGRVDHRTVPAYLSVADVCVAFYPHLPSEMWFSPMKLYEYMAAGKAIVASRSGQIIEVLQHDHTGVLVEPGDVDGLAQAIIDLLENPAKRKRLEHNARRQAVEQHSWECYIEKLTEVYRSVIGGENSHTSEDCIA